MKKIFAFAIALVSMAVSMTSCNNDETDFIEQPAPMATVAPKQESTPKEQPAEEVFDGNLYFCAYPEQLACMDVNYIVKVGDEEINIDVKELEVLKQYPQEIVASMVRAERLNRKTGTKFVDPDVYVYHIPAQMHGEISIIPMLTVKEGCDMPESFDAAYGISTNLKCSFHYENVESENVEGLINAINGIHFDNVAKF